MKRCKSCKFYKPDDGDSYGKCESPKFEYFDKPETDDGVSYMDYEMYSAWFAVGKDFGCVHYSRAWWWL